MKMTTLLAYSFQLLPRIVMTVFVAGAATTGYASHRHSQWSVPQSTDSITVQPQDTVNVTDTAAYNILPDLNVSASREFHTSGQSTYIPTRREKNASRDALSLLDKMNIPQISKNPDGKYTAFNGTEVIYYINGHPAQSQDLESMNLSDVRKVCFLDHPAGAEYLGAQYVVEFITQQYEYGGYTRVGEDAYFVGMAGFTESVASKFSYKRMIYDLYANVVNSNYLRNALEGESTFHLPSATVIREDRVKHSNYRNEEYPVQFRAAYSHGDTYISNDVGFQYTSLSRAHVDGTIGLTKVGRPGEESEYAYTGDSPSGEHSVAWNGFALFELGRGWSLSAKGNAYYTHLKQHYSYVTDQPFSIDRRVRENSLYAKLNVMASKRISATSSLSLDLTGISQTSRSSYSGDSNFKNRFSFPTIFGKLTYSYSTTRFSATAYAGLAGERQTLNGYTVKTIYPFGVVNLAYSPHRRSQLSLWMQYSTFSPTSNMKNPTPVEQSELLWKIGNPDLKSYPKFEVGPSYTWSPTGIFTLGASAMYTHLHDMMTTVYSVMPDGGGVMESYANKGSSNVVAGGVVANLRLFNGRLTLSARPTLTLYRGSGIDMPDLNAFGLSSSAIVYVGNFYAQAAVSIANKDYDGYTMSVIRRKKPFYYFSFGWGNGNWRVAADLYKIFNTSWVSSKSQVWSPVYSNNLTKYGIGSRQLVYVSVSYTFSYGKKIGMGNELNGSVGSAPSSVLK